MWPAVETAPGGSAALRRKVPLRGLGRGEPLADVAGNVAGILADFIADFAAVAVFWLGTAGVDRSEMGIFQGSGDGRASLRGADRVAVFAGDVAGILAGVAGILAGAMAACDMVELIAVFAAISR